MSAIHHPVFIADVHLGTLAKALRMLGFNTLYSNSYTPEELVETARQEERILLSKSEAFGRLTGISFLQISSSKTEEQLQQVVHQYFLRELLRPFTRCLICNGELTGIAKERIVQELEFNTRKAFNEFWQCLHCNRIYWKGSHYERMQKLVAKVITDK